MTADLRQLLFPYCLQRRDAGQYVVLNRRYKPVGFTTGDWVTYEDYPVLLKLKGLGPATAAKLSWDGSSDLDRIYLYNDGCIPTDSAAHWTDYAARLKLLAKLHVEDVR